MRNICLLMKNYCNTFIGSFAKSKKVGKYVVALTIIIVSSLAMLAFFTYNSYVITSEFIKLSDNYEYANFAMFYNCATLLMMTGLMIVMRAAVPAQVTDADLLQSLPIKKNQIIIAKSLTAYFLDFIVLFIFLFPSFIIFVILVKGAAISIIFRSLLMILLVPLLSNGLSVLIGTLINSFAKKTRFVSLVQTVLMLVLIALFFVFNYYINGILTKSSNLNLDEVVNKIFLVKFVYQFILNNKIIYFVILLLASVLIYGFSVFIRSITFGRKHSYYQNKHTNLEYVQKSPFRVLLKKESSRFFSLPIYVMNVIIGLVIMIGMAGYILFKGRDFIDVIIVNILKGDLTSTPYFLAFVACALIGTVCTTYCSISLEGKTFWILKAHPINEMTIFKAKIAFNLILSGSGILISSIILSLAFGFQYLIVFLILPLLSALFTAQFGLLLNLIYPRLEWESETVPIKQSIAVLIVMGVGGVIPLILLVAFILLSSLIPPLLIILLDIIILIILNILIYRLLKTKGTKLFKEIY